MTDRAFHDQQTRAAWTLCWIAAVSGAVFSKFYAPQVLVAVLILATANIIFCQKFVREPSQRGVHTAREVLLLNNSRAICTSGLFIIYAVCAIGRLRLGLLQVGGMLLLAIACALAGARYASNRWKTLEDLERTARESTVKGLEFRSRYPIYVFAAVSVIWSGVSRSLGDNAVAGFIGSACTAFGSHLFGTLIAQQMIVRRLLPAARARMNG